MSAVMSPARHRAPAMPNAGVACNPEPRLALLGSGTVGQAFVARYQGLRDAGIALPPLRLLANSRGMRDGGDDPSRALASVAELPQREQGVIPDLDALSGGDVVVDAEYYRPTSLGAEGALKERWERIRRLIRGR